MKAAFRYLENIKKFHEHYKNIKPYDLWCVNAHATSTPKGDAAEMKAINKFIEHLQCSYLSNIVETSCEGVHVTSHKGNFGHLMGAAGAVESAFVALSLQEKNLPPTSNVDNLDEDMDSKGKTRIVREMIDNSNESNRAQKLVLKNSFGFGGTNVSLLYGEFPS